MVIIERLGAAVINLKFILLMLSLFLSMDILIRDKTKSRLQVLNTMRVCGISNNNCELQCYCLAIILNVSCTSWKRLLRLLLKNWFNAKKKKHLKAILMTRQELTWGEKVTSISRWKTVKMKYEIKVQFSSKNSFHLFTTLYQAGNRAQCPHNPLYIPKRK